MRASQTSGFKVPPIFFRISFVLPTICFKVFLHCRTSVCPDQAYLLCLTDATQEAFETLKQLLTEAQTQVFSWRRMSELTLTAPVVCSEVDIVTYKEEVVQSFTEAWGNPGHKQKRLHDQHAAEPSF